jgi:tetratricopeptide (TPR) repeat protein
MNKVDSGDRIVLPQWFAFAKAAQLRETDVSAEPVRTIDYGPSIQAFRDVMADFQADPAPFVGSELMGIAVVLDQAKEAKELATYVLDQKIVGRVAIDQANRILHGSRAITDSPSNSLIRGKKARVREFPRDAIAWIDQARLYTIMGQREKARRAVLIALHLAPTNRLIVRSAVRFFVHFDEWDTAAFYGQKAYEITKDPLILGPLLSVRTQLQKFPERLRPIANSALGASNTFLFSEVLASIGTTDILQGAEKRSRKFFKRAWEDPTRAVVSQSQWVLREHLPNLAPEQSIDFSQSAEARSWLRFAIMDFKGALVDARDWILEEPFSKPAHIHASHTACLIGAYEEAESAARQGLRANPDDRTLRNNLVFAELRRGKIEDAEKSFAPLKSSLSDPKEIAPLATYGLLLMTQGHIMDGRLCYEQAIERATVIGDNRMAIRAALHLVISMLDMTRRIDTEVLQAVTGPVRELQDAACLGTASVLACRLRSADLSKSQNAKESVEAFLSAVEEAEGKLSRSEFTDSVRTSIEDEATVGEQHLLVRDLPIIHPLPSRI